MKGAASSAVVALDELSLRLVAECAEQERSIVIWAYHHTIWQQRLPAKSRRGQQVLFLSFCAAKCIDQYVELSVKANESKEKQPPLDPRLVAIVERMLNK